MTTESLVLVGVVLLAVLVGMIIPVLLQLRATLKSAQSFLDSTSLRLDSVMADVSKSVAKLNRLADEVQGSAAHAQKILGTLQGVTDDIERVRGSLKFVATLGPAAFAATRSFVSSLMSNRAAEPDEEGDEPSTKNPHSIRPPSQESGAAAG